jgi:hypothetical protein
MANAAMRRVALVQDGMASIPKACAMFPDKKQKVPESIDSNGAAA